jgi:phage host-nuclease inhibitor protein Gam
MKKISQILPGLLAGLIALTGCEKVAKVITEAENKDKEAELKIDYAALDKDAEEEIKESSAEARAWLGMKNNQIFEGSKTNVTALTEQFYKAGCPKVYITGIEKLGGVFLSASMVVVLPTDPAQRAAAFKAEKEFVEKEGEDGSEDKGQKYLSLTFD